ncbi:MAG: hypothetical protein PVF27_05165, partial [Gemmatimonadales bacterium]
EVWARTHDIPPAQADARRHCLLLIDCQNTFCIPEFELFVAGRDGRGAVDDNVRLCEFLYRNLDHITDVIATLDTHTALQIFHPVFWVDDDGRHPAGGQTIIDVDDVEHGTWRVNPAVAHTLGVDLAWLERHALHYVRTLAEQRYPLMVWPYHAISSGISHALVSAVDEAVFFHSVARASQARFETKGANPFTENYSALGPEVRDGPDGQPLGRVHAELTDRLLQYDALIVAGQAKSHCVAWTVQDLLTEIEARDPQLAEKVYLLEDCTSAVVVSDAVDFTDDADAAFARFAEAGMHCVRSTDPIATWPGPMAEGS